MSLQSLLNVLPGARAVALPPLKKKPPEQKWQLGDARDPTEFAEGVNFGVHIGPRVVVIDVEGPDKKGEEKRKGVEDLARLEERLGSLPPTVETLTPSRGRHLYYLIPDGVDIKHSRHLLGALGIELLTGPHYAVAPPSQVPNKDGEIVAYRFADGRAPGEVDVPELPPVWVEAITKAQASWVMTEYQHKEASGERREVPLAPIVAGCAFMGTIGGEGAATASEPEWFAWLSILAYVEGGREIAHAIGSCYPGYSADETNRKFDHACDTKPRTCNYIANEIGFAGCATCPFRNFAGVRSPVTFGDQPTNLVKVQRRVIFIGPTRQYLDLKTGNKWSHQAFADWIRSEVGRNPHGQLMASRTTIRVDREDYLPGDDRLIVNNGVNLWQRSGVAPADGDASPIVNFVQYLFPNQNEAEHVLNYLAFLLQLRGVKIKHGLMIVGGFGAGKSTLARIAAKLFGRNARKVDGAQLASKWQADLVNCELLIAEEAAHGEKWEVSERLKSLVTDELFTVEEKGVAPVRGRTPMGIIINSNHDAPLVVAQGDRRWAVLQAVAQENVASPAYFSQLHAEIDDDVSLPAFAKFLLNRDIASFKPHGPPPMTDAKQVAISASRTPLAQILKESIELELGPFYREVVSPEEVLAHLERSPYDHGKVGPQKLAQALRSCGAVQLEKTRRVGLPSVRPWAIRNPAKWVAATPDAVRAELTRQLVPMAGVHVLRPDRPPVPYPHVGEEAAKA